MGNFIDTFKQGKAGLNKGLTTGIPSLDKAINGIQKKSTVGIAAAPKVGKTTLADYSFVLSPYLEAVKNNTLDKLHWIYFSGEVDRVSKEFKFSAFFFYYDYGIKTFSYKGVTYGISETYLMGKLLHKNPDGSVEVIIVSQEHEEILKKIYTNRITVLFGVYNSRGEQLKKGLITFIENLENPTGIYKGLINYYRNHGEIVTQKFKVQDDKGHYVEQEKIIGYVPNDPEKFTIVVTDHVRKLQRERGFSMKDNIDKFLEYTTWIRNIFHTTFVHIIHLNRGLANIDRLKFMGEFIYPTGDDVKDTGNISEEVTVLLTMFDPQDEKYNLKRHFGVDLEPYPNYRSIHVADQRYGESPLHIQTNMYGNLNLFLPLI